MSSQVILRVVAKLLIPYILLFGLYVQFHGDYGPGGGFQAGVIFAAAFVLYSLIFGLEATQRIANPVVLETIFSLGLLLFAGTGVVTMLLGGNFLDYNALSPKHVHEAQHYALLVVEFGVGLTVAAGILTIFYNFAGREHVQ